jgi:phosphohistidine swiveling domain-containing protein
MTRMLPHVSDHAVLRYLESAHGVPVDEIRILLATSAEIGVRHQAPVVCLEKVKLVIRDGTVVTVLKREWHGRVRRPRK